MCNRIEKTRRLTWDSKQTKSKVCDGVGEDRGLYLNKEQDREEKQGIDRVGNERNHGSQIYQ
jgi:hypothetical protein